MQKLAIGIDIGGTKVEGSLVNDAGLVLKSKRLPTQKNYALLKKEILSLIEELRAVREPPLRDSAILGVGFSIPGSIDPKTRKLRNAPNSPEINGTTFFDDLACGLDVPVRCENDANCLALSEHLFGAGIGVKNIFGLIMGTGFGGGLIHDGKLFTGRHGLAPEPGHTILEINGRQCLCGNQGCVEAYLSGPSIIKRFVEAGGDAQLKQTHEIFLAAAGDGTAKKIVQETLYYFARFIAALVSWYDPEMIVIGGGLSRIDAFYTCDDEIKKYVFGARDAPKIVAAQNGDASGKLGAAALFF